MNTNSSNLLNGKNTKNELFKNLEFEEFAINERKKEIQKNFKEILKNNPEIYKIIEENENLKKNNKILLDENIELGEMIESLKRKIDINSNNRLIKENRILNQEIEQLKEKIKTNFEISNKNIEAFKILEKEYLKIKAENKELNEKRGLFNIAKDKTKIAFYISENKELKKKLERIGRIPISDYQVKQIINLFNSEYSYEKIAKTVGVAKSTVSNYVQKYLKGKLKEYE